MKVTPRNQTLILASERRAQGDKSSSTLDQALKTASSGGVLQRVTIVAKQPDTSIVYLHADYATATPTDDDADKSPGASSASAVTTTSRTSGTPTPGNDLVVSAESFTERDEHGNRQTASRDVGLSSYLKPVEQYAQTQRILAGPRATAGVDLLA